MKILIINLPRYQGSSVTREGRCELLLNYRVDTPATLLIIASLLRKNNYEIDFIDANGLNIGKRDIIIRLKNKKYGCIIFTFVSEIIDHELSFCDLFKKINPSCTTIGFSWYAKNFGEEILNEFRNLDILIIDDPFSVIEDLIKNLDKSENLSDVGGIVYRNYNNEIKKNPKLNKRIKFNDLPIPAYDLLTTFKPYYIYSPLLRPYALIYAGKGCPFGCAYCNVANTKYSGKSAVNIIKELKVLKKLGKIKYIWFFDEIFTINRKRVVEICKKMIQEKIKIKWLCDSRVDLVDEELLRLMRKAGCIGIAYGIESGSQKILNSMNKGITIEQARNALKWTRKAHIPIQLNLIFGYIGENKKTLKETEFFVRNTLPEFLQITKMMALENTDFMHTAIKNEWMKEDLHWKTNLIVTRKKLINYSPYDLDLRGERKKLEKALYLNPKWWFICFRTLIRNPKLIMPIFGIILNKSQSINLL